VTGQPVTAWTASAATRDFRPSEWKSQPTKAVKEETGDSHRYSLSVPQTGYAALFGEAMFEDDGVPFYLSTNVRIVGKEKPKP